LTSAPTSGAPDPITLRLRALEIAANCVGRFAECREQVRTADVFPLADKLLAWVLDSSPGQDRADLAR
jgi:hypothetical protein